MVPDRYESREEIKDRFEKQLAEREKLYHETEEAKHECEIQISALSLRNQELEAMVKELEVESKEKYQSLFDEYNESIKLYAEKEATLIKECGILTLAVDIGDARTQELDGKIQKLEAQIAEAKKVLEYVRKGLLKHENSFTEASLHHIGADWMERIDTVLGGAGKI